MNIHHVKGLLYGVIIGGIWINVVNQYSNFYWTNDCKNLDNEIKRGKLVLNNCIEKYEENPYDIIL
jgi:hypothetical protein